MINLIHNSSLRYFGISTLELREINHTVFNCVLPLKRGDSAFITTNINDICGLRFGSYRHAQKILMGKITRRLYAYMLSDKCPALSRDDNRRLEHALIGSVSDSTKQTRYRSESKLGIGTKGFLVFVLTKSILYAKQSVLPKYSMIKTFGNTPRFNSFKIRLKLRSSSFICKSQRNDSFNCSIVNKIINNISLICKSKNNDSFNCSTSIYKSIFRNTINSYIII